jgi:hypothetical protein
MKRALALALVAAVLLAGCGARANRDQFFGYMKKPIYASGFALEDARATPQTQQFFVEDGSIGKVSVQVWVNATAGTATVQIVNAHGDTIVNTASSTTVSVPVDLGAWKITVSGSPDAAGRADVLVKRA